MLQSLHIINFAIIKDTVLDPAFGVTICTGETGSGKSIVIDALAVLMGRRAKTDFIRTGADYFKIEGVFYNQSLKDKEISDKTKNLGTKQNQLRKKISIEDHIKVKNIENELEKILSNLNKKLQIEEIRDISQSAKSIRSSIESTKDWKI